MIVLPLYSIMTFMSTFLCSVPINPNALKKKVLLFYLVAPFCLAIFYVRLS